MIAANDLRIGNWILWDNSYVKVNEIKQYSGNEYYVKGVGLNNYTNYINNIDFFEPIPLTEEILLKCGCKKSSDCLWLPIYNLKAEFHFEIFDNTDEIVTTIESQFSDLILDRIKYLHELQNLFYSLSKTELIINL